MKIDLDFIRQNDWHEKYILGQLTETEKFAYERFISDNANARRELEQERKLIAAIRSAGSNTIKKEIKHQADKLRTPKADWTIIYKAAAVLFVFVLLPSVIYYQYFKLDSEQSIPAVTKAPQVLAEQELEVSEQKPQETSEEQAMGRKEIASKSGSPGQLQKKAPDESIKREKGVLSKNILEEKPALAPSTGIAEYEASDKNKSILSSTKKAIPDKSDLISDQRYDRESQENMNLSSRLMIGGAGKSNIAQKQKRFTFNINNQNISLVLNKYETTTGLPDSLKLVLNKSKAGMDINIMVPDLLFAAKKKELFIEKKNNKYTLTFYNQNRYTFNNDSTETVARKIK